jgi:hypothetical protein
MRRAVVDGQEMSLFIGYALYTFPERARGTHSVIGVIPPDSSRFSSEPPAKPSRPMRREDVFLKAGTAAHPGEAVFKDVAE